MDESAKKREAGIKRVVAKVQVRKVLYNTRTITDK